jgi:hypothetical protein
MWISGVAPLFPAPLRTLVADCVAIHQNVHVPDPCVVVTFMINVVPE